MKSGHKIILTFINLVYPNPLILEYEKAMLNKLGHFFLAFIILFTFSPAGCAQPHVAKSDKLIESQEIEEVLMPTEIQQNPASRVVNHFAMRLYAQLNQQEKNVFLSPYSISTVLMMVYAGAQGNTKAQMAKMLHLTDTRGQTIHNSFSQLSRSLVTKAGVGYYLYSAHDAWVQQNKNVLTNDFVKLLQHFYHTQVKALDFAQAPEMARQRINQWVSQKTAQNIPELITPSILSRNTQLLLTNAVYFKGKWQSAFDPKKTKDSLFTRLDNIQLKVPMMHQIAQVHYWEDQAIQQIELPYQTSEPGAGLSLSILLPKKMGELSEVEKKLADYLQVNSYLSTVSIYLPKFKVDATFQLKKILKTLGMTEAFEPSQADFSGITGKRDLIISDVIHKAFVEVNEMGTEAAAATVIVASKSLPVIFQADHPFIFWIKDRLSGTVLFLGKVMVPQI
jgi:serpin B